MKYLFTPEDFKKKILRYYSPYNFLREYPDLSIIKETLLNHLEDDYNSKKNSLITITVQGYSHRFIYKKLEWDTSHFNFPNYKIELVLYEHKNVSILRIALNQFLKKINKIKNAYFSFNIPCEDITLIQAISGTKFILVETRLNYYLTNISNYNFERYPVRMANYLDIPLLRQIAKTSRNPYDRVHSDPAFSQEEADNYIGTFAEESIKGFADFVLIPNLPDKPPFGFLACNNPVNVFDLKISKLVLAAIDSTKEKGWLFKLLSEVIYELKKKNTDILTTITQSSNRPAINAWEKAGFKLAYITHIFSIKTND